MLGETLKFWLMIAWLLPLAGFAVEILFGFGHFSKNPRHSKAAAWCAVGCIGTGFLCSLIALLTWGQATEWSVLADEGHGYHGEHVAAHSDEAAAHNDEGHHVADANEDHETAHADDDHEEDAHGAAASVPTAYSGIIYSLGSFGDLDLTIDYYIDSLTLVMFTMVTLIATCIHLFAMGYMGDELTDDYVDHFAHTADGKHVHRPGRFYRFFAFLSLFCFSMLGLVLAGNIFQVFVFWELVGICSFLLIGFYTERKTASNAANKAFIMNRVGDFGFLIGLMVLWTYFGTFRFADTPLYGDDGAVVETQQGLFSMVHRDETGNFATDDFGDVLITDSEGHVHKTAEGRDRTIPYFLLVVAGLGVFGGCVGKSAQFPLQTWLPDAMEGPTPVSALVHSATMVAAGVYLVGRFFPMFAQEVLLTIAYTGCITLFVAATIAVVATDIKKVLAYSTISQLGYMMLGLGVFGWAAGLFHLITHAFFKSLMFLCSGSVIHGCHHEQEMPKMGGLLKKMPITALTMLVGVCAIAGFPTFSGFHSKDAIVASAMAFTKANPVHFLLFFMPLLTAGITAFYMFRLWFFTFWGKPRDQHVYDHAHESPWIMCVPLLILAPFAWLCAIGGEGGFLYQMLTGDEPAHLAGGVKAITDGALTLPSHDAIHEVHAKAGTWALIAAFSGALIAYFLYGTNKVNLEEMKKQLSGVHGFLVNKWHFDELYDALFMQPAHKVAAFCAWFDKAVFDSILHGSAKVMVVISKWDRMFDERVVDGLVNLVGSATQSVGASLKVVQTGRVRQYVMFIVLGVVALFAVVFTTFPG